MPILCRSELDRFVDLPLAYEAVRRGLAGQVLLKIVYLLMRWLFSLAVVVVRCNWAKNAELLVLRQENTVLRRNVGPVRYEPADRAWFAALTRFIPRRRWAEVFLVTPATLLAWHRGLAARKYDTSKWRRPGRPPTARSIARLTIRLAHETRSGDTAESTANWPSSALESRHPSSMRSSAPQASTTRRAGTARPGASSCTRRPPGSW